jgi:hypothetical protein
MRAPDVPVCRFQPRSQQFSYEDAGSVGIALQDFLEAS